MVVIKEAHYMETKWKLGDDLIGSDSLLDGITFDDVILAVHHNCRQITPAAVITTAHEIIEERMQDFDFLLENNIEEIMVAALKGRKQYGSNKPV